MRKEAIKATSPPPLQPLKVLHPLAVSILDLGVGLIILEGKVQFFGSILLFGHIFRLNDDEGVI